MNDIYIYILIWLSCIIVKYILICTYKYKWEGAQIEPELDRPLSHRV